MNTKPIREHYGMTQTEFSEAFSIPYRTVTNWDMRDCMPGYLYQLFWQLIATQEELYREKEKAEKGYFIE